MTQNEIREVVKITIDELLKNKILDIDNYQTALRAVEVNLYTYFDGTNKDCIGVSKLLNSLSDDPYIDVIYLNYRDGKTLEFIAEVMDKDISTIKRNKKRLIFKLYEMLEEK